MRFKEPIYGRSEKFDWVVEKIEEILGYHEQVVVFSHFLGMLDLLEAAMQEKRIAYGALTAAHPTASN